MLPVTDWPWNKKNTSELGRLETQENPTVTNVMGRLHGHAMFVIMGCTALPTEHYNGQSVNKEWDTPTGCVQATDIIFTTFHLQSFYSWTVWFQNSLHTVMNRTSTFAVLPVLCVKSFVGIWYSDAVCNGITWQTMNTKEAFRHTIFTCQVLLQKWNKETSFGDGSNTCGATNHCLLVSAMFGILQSQPWGLHEHFILSSGLWLMKHCIQRTVLSFLWLRITANMHSTVCLSTQHQYRSVWHNSIFFKLEIAQS